MARKSILAAHHPLPTISVIQTEKGSGGLVDEPYGLSGQGAVFLGYLQCEVMVYVLAG